MTPVLTPLVDLDGTLVDLELDWDRARDEAERQGLPRQISHAVAQDRDGTFRSWLDAFETTATIVPVHAPLHRYLAQRTWALVTNNGRPVVDRAVGEGHLPRPTVIVTRSASAMKPAPDPLVAALAELARHGDPFPVYIGDAATDRAAAAAAGMPFLPVTALRRG